MNRRGTVALLALLLALVAGGCKDPANAQPGGPQPGRSASASPVRGLPSSMVALGDSLTAGYGSCVLLVACKRNSWATGDSVVVDSHYRRIVAQNPAMRGHARNLGVPGARAADLAGQVRAAGTAPADYVTLLIGANDACHGRIGDMTEPRAFRSTVDGALATLRKAMPRARVLVVSIPDIHQLWQVGHTSARATRAWAHGICPALLANPTSTAAADVSRRKAFRDRIRAYNGQLEGACAAYGSRCRTDRGAAHRISFGLGHLAADYFHPNVDGQARIARASYPSRFTW